MGSTTSKPVLAVTSIKIERGRLDALKRIAHANHRTMAQEIRWLIDQRIAEAEAAPA